MVSEDRQGVANAAGGESVPSLTDGLLAALTGADEATKFRVISDLLAGIADQASQEASRPGASEEIESLSRRVKEQAEQQATLNDRIRTLQVELDQRDAHLGSERSRAEKFKSIADEQTSRMEGLQARTKELETLLDARNKEIHKANVETESLTLQLQRSDAKAHDQSKVSRADEKILALEGENARLREQIEQLRKDKNSELERVGEDLAAARVAVAAKQDIDFPALWSRLAACKPPLVEGHLETNVKAGERLVDSYIELVKFVDDFDKLMRPFLSRYASARPRLRAVWEAYARGTGLRDTIQQIIVPEGGRPTGILRNQLRALYKWTEAAIWGCEAAIESIGSEMPTFMRSKEAYGMGSDSTRKISEFILENGPDAFSDHMKGIRSAKIAQFFGVNVNQ